MTVSLVQIKQEVADRYEAELTDARHSRFIAAAVRYYSRYNPHVKTQSFSTVADQQAYDLPLDCVTVKGVLWLPAGDVIISGAERLAIHQKQLLEAFNQWALRHIDEIVEDEYHRVVQGHWEVRNDELVLWPVPSTALHTVSIVYGALHVLNEEGTAYETVPDADIDLVAQLTLAELLLAKYLGVALEPDWAEGLTRVSYRSVPQNAQDAVLMLRRSTQQKYGGAVARVSL